ncbi:hypothetical protein [Actinomadura sp. 21ATH]|uniref:hypothetical protein n=1 Tax=Actinomadura sp. 21ATH TaxID=1735444 RepID=UPI0035C243C6
MLITLPEPYDVQVATRWPAVDAYRRGYSLVTVLQLRADRLGDALMDTIRSYPPGEPAYDRIRQTAYDRYQEAAAALTAAREVLPDLAQAADRACGVAAERARLSVERRVVDRVEAVERYERDHEARRR